jgi:flagella basal body P-ring formation protein FlgA
MKILLSLLLPAWVACAAGPLDRILDAIPRDARPPASTPLLQAQPPAQARPAFSLTTDALVAELERQVATHFGADGDLKLSIARTWADLRLPEKDWLLTIAEWPIGGLADTLVLRIKIVSGAETIVEGQLPLRAQLWQDVWFSTTQLERGQALDRNSLTSQKADVLRERIPAVSANVDPSTLELCQTVGPGRALTRRDVTARPLIRKGQLVEVFAKSGSFGVRMKALALENGAVGDLITLRNVESRKEFNGHVTHESKVQVQF